MSPSLPADPPSARSLTGVVTEALAALEQSSTWFPPATSAIVVVLDGLGAHNLAARRGHARFLASLSSKREVARTVFPSTTASALTSLLTGTPPGQHGIVGYKARRPGTDTAPNQLKGWETDGLDPRTWQRAVPLMERESGRGRPCFVVSRPEYSGSGFTEATLRGGEQVSAESLVDRMEIAADLAARHRGALIYVYGPDLDVAGHRYGWESEEWTQALESVDDAARRLGDRLPAGTGALITADHGMVDVPAHRHVLLDDSSGLLDGVALIGGEPRMLHLYAEPGGARSLADRWREAESGRSWVLTRDEAITADLFGAVDPAVTERIGDVLVAARAAVAYYDDRLEDKGAQRMVGQHGSLTPEERVVPLLRMGAFA